MAEEKMYKQILQGRLSRKKTKGRPKKRQLNSLEAVQKTWCLWVYMRGV